MWGLKKRLNSRRERRDLEIGVYLGRRRGSDVTSHVYWDISPAFLNPDFGTKAGKIRPFCEADLQGVRLPRPARCDSAGAQCGEPALARGQAASPNVDPAARASLSGSQRPAAARRARRTREKTRPPAKLKTRSRGTLRPAGPRTEPLASSSSDVSRILSEASLRCVKRKVNLGGGGKKTVKGVAEACRCLPCPPPAPSRSRLLERLGRLGPRARPELPGGGRWATRGGVGGCARHEWETLWMGSPAGLLAADFLSGRWHCFCLQ